jgi:uncharacterized glyoxalase superfamily protein PhnB
MVNSKHVPAGWPTVIPRIAVDDPEALVAFIQHVFGAVDRFHPERPSEVRIGDSIVMVGSTVDRRAMPAFLYVYVEDADRVFQRALDRGAKSLEEPQDMPYGDRRAMFGIPGTTFGRSLPIVGVSHGKSAAQQADATDGAARRR